MRGLRFVLIWAAATVGFGATLGTTDLDGKAVDPFVAPAKVRVLVFVRTDCPISNRYAPELKRLTMNLRRTVRCFRSFMPIPVKRAPTSAITWRSTRFREPRFAIQRHLLVRRAKATITPEAAVFSGSGALLYHGRIDNRYVEVGKSMPNPTRHDLEDAIAAALDGRPQPEASAPAVGCYLVDVE